MKQLLRFHYAVLFLLIASLYVLIVKFGPPLFARDVARDIDENKKDQESISESVALSNKIQHELVNNVNASSYQKTKKPKKFLDGDVVFESSIGFDDGDVGVSGSDNALGPAGFSLGQTGDVIILDQFNRRVLIKRVEDEKTSVLFNYNATHSIDGEDIYSSVAMSLSSKKEEVLLLSGYGAKSLDRYSLNGQLLSSIAITLPDDDEPRNVFTASNGDIFIEGLLHYYCLEEDDTVKKLPGKPFLYDDQKFIDAKRISRGKFQISVLSDQGQTSNALTVDRPYDAVNSVVTDKENNIYIVFERTVQSSEAAEDGHYQILVNQLVIEIFDQHLKHMNTIPYERFGNLEYEQDHIISGDGVFYRFVDDEKQIKIIKHVLDKKGSFKTNNVSLDE